MKIGSRPGVTTAVTTPDTLNKREVCHEFEVYQEVDETQIQNSDSEALIVPPKSV